MREILQREGIRSEYLEVGTGPDAEVFTKSQPMSAVGHDACVGSNAIPARNNPEPKIVSVVNGRREIVGATLGNDLNLRDVEGRSALLLGKAKDNNASCAIGPFIRLFDDGFTMAEISRKPADLVARASGRNRQYPMASCSMLPRRTAGGDAAQPLW